jgi:hypothetical protein
MDKLKTTRRDFAKLVVAGAAGALPARAEAPTAPPPFGHRDILALDGDWKIGEGVEPDAIPSSFNHTVPVPGLVHNATPAFPDVDQYETREFILNMIDFGLKPASETTEALGRTRQKRNYFWYQKTFTAPARRQVAILRINKAQFGTAVWLNGKKIGDHLGCFTRGYFNLTGAINWEGENKLLVRIGAHPGAVPNWVPTGSDQEKPVWTAGIYDSVSLHLCDNPVIESVQAAPQIGTSSVIVQTTLHNYGSETDETLVQQVRPWKGSAFVGKPLLQHVTLARGEIRTLTQTIPIPGAVLWSPEAPFLYVVETSANGDSVSTRFGMREFRFDNIARRAMLNGKPYFLRGTNITLHRFLGDPLSKQHPWEEAWVRKLLVEIPHRMNWNAMRICIGPLPEKWLDIADEAGLLLQYEYAIWTGRYPWRHELWRTEELISEFTEYVRDNCNHPSIAIWDASNETVCDALREKVIPAVRGLDLSHRPWDNGYNVPQAPGDAYEDHPYIFSFVGKLPYYDLQALQNMQGPPILNAPPSGHAAILNEYDTLFLKRDGTPVFWTQKFFDALLNQSATAGQRFALRAYLLAGLTEFWRAFRFYAGVMYLAYLDADLPHSVTCDNFLDPERLVFQPHFEEYVKEAFKPLGVYLRFWKSNLLAGDQQRLEVMMVNDEYETAKGHLTLAFSTANSAVEAARAETEFEIPPLGQMTYVLKIQTPSTPAAYVLSASAVWPSRPWSPVISRRNVTVVAKQT